MVMKSVQGVQQLKGSKKSKPKNANTLGGGENTNKTEKNWKDTLFENEIETEIVTRLQRAKRSQCLGTGLRKK